MLSHPARQELKRIFAQPATWVYVTLMVFACAGAYAFGAQLGGAQ